MDTELVWVVELVINHKSAVLDVFDTRQKANTFTTMYEKRLKRGNAWCEIKEWRVR